ncbi:MAG: hybrid sensor histidine kinase/response regulator [Candidatus Binatia bacterium]|nr:MAG: hybrid sensor histidine kinase/response regulator [Candidatus Binatia bacterium]
MPEPGTLLIVDDERGPMESLRMIFKPYYKIFTADSGARALEIVQREPIDVVTLDLRMPGMSGIEVMQEIKSRDPDIEVIIVTGYSSLETAIRGLRYRAFDYISKPFDVHDIMDLVERALAQRRSRLRLRKAKEDFLANLSHELRTPLSAIIGYSDILSEELQRQLSPDLRQALERIQANSQELLQLIENVLFLNSLEGGDVGARIEMVDVRALAERVVLRFQPAAAKKGIELAVQGAASGLPFPTDPGHFERLLGALLDNAVKFSDRGPVVVRLERQSNGDLWLQVVDSGIGMTREELEQVVQGLSQADPSNTRRYRGLGLGLRTANRLAELLGGALHIQSEKGRGTVASVHLPLRVAQDVRATSH